MRRTIIIGNKVQCDFFAENIGQIDNCEIVGFYDPYAGANANAAMNAIDIIELNNKAEVFVIDNKTFKEFYESIETLIKFGKDILVNGYLALEYNGLRKLENLTFESGSTLQIGNVLRNKPLYAAASQIIKKPRYIKLSKNTPNPEKGNFEQWVNNQLVEELDTVLRLSGANFRSVAARPLFLYSSTPDMLSIHIEFDNDAICQITAGSAVANGKNKAQFFQKDRLISLDFANNQLKEFRLKDESMQLSMINDDEVKSTEFTEIERSIMPYDIWVKEWKNFDESIGKAITPLTSISDCQNLQMIVDSIMDKVYRKYQAV
jgi:predicted dehydrogenase